MTQKAHTLSGQLYANYSKVKITRKNSKIVTAHVFHYYNTLWTDITKIAGEKKKKVHGASNLALILLFILSNETGKWSPTEISHCSCFNPPSLISQAAQIKGRPFSWVWCGACGQSRHTKPFVCQGCAEQPALVAGTVPGCSVLLEKCSLSVTWKMKQFTALGRQGEKIIMG